MQTSDMYSEIAYNQEKITWLDFGIAFSSTHENGIEKLKERLGVGGNGLITTTTHVYFVDEKDTFCALYCGLPTFNRPFPHNVLLKIEGLKKDVVNGLATDSYYMSWDSSQFLIVLPYSLRESLLGFKQSMDEGKVGVVYTKVTGLGLFLQEEAIPPQTYTVTYTGTLEMTVEANSMEEAKALADKEFNPEFLKSNIKVEIK